MMSDSSGFFSRRIVRNDPYVRQESSVKRISANDLKQIGCKNEYGLSYCSTQKEKLRFNSLEVLKQPKGLTEESQSSK